MSKIYTPRSKVSEINSTNVPLAAGATYTGAWQNAEDFNSVIVAAKTDQNCTITVEFSVDRQNVDFTGLNYNADTNTIYDVYDDQIVLSSGDRDNKIDLRPPEPFPIAGPGIFWIEADTNADNTNVFGRFSGKFRRDVDA